MNDNEYIPVQVPVESYKLPYKNEMLDVVRVIVDKDEYSMCEESSHNMWANEKKGVWGKGYKNTKDDPYKVERAGRLAEMAFCKLSGTGIDFSYIKGGDKKDTIYKGKFVNVKTAFALYGEIMVRYSMNNRILLLHEDVWVFSYINDDQKKKIAIVYFLGCLLKFELIQKRKVSKESWINYQCPYSELHSMNQLLSV